MAGALDVAGDIASASTALGGLLLVFMGSIANSYESFDPASRRAVKQKFSRRVNLVAVGFGAALIATVAALLGKWIATPWLVVIAGASLLVSLLVISVAASLTVMDVS